ncbi:MAG: Flp pilus assembly complex ATPase component TadA [Endomicrobiales bacterium]|nr:Flp pilus assembly complex ATPase component TadA [Endomicrobiales bacterium]
MAIAPLRKKYIGEILLENNFITKEQLKEALSEQQKTKEKIGTILIKRGYIKEEDLMKCLAISFRIPYVRLVDLKVDDAVLKLVPEKMARRFMALPVAKREGAVQIAMADPSNVNAIDEIEAETKLKVSVSLSSEKELKEAIERHYAGGLMDVKDLPDQAVGEIKTDELEELSKDDYEAADAAPIIKYVNALLYEAVTKSASDIHLEPEENGVALRMRLDGELRESPPPPKKFFNAIVSRIKIIANLDIAERRLPQDGKCKMKIGDKKVDVRVSTLPTIYGEKVVLRVLDRTTVSLQLDDLGFSKEDAEKFREALQRPHGMILVTGPTGSGKTTTLYTGLSFINTPEKNIVTVEDPVEYELKKINQVQVKPQIGLSFAHVLRSVLRQDPDVIMVGEIRDKETAEIAVQAALTGHLVLSTLHTNDAVSSLSRLGYMGIEPILIADAVDLVIAQRLIRKICPNCKELHELPAKMLEKLDLKDKHAKVYHGVGCEKCFGTGYKGRSVISEVLKLSTPIKKMILAGEGDVVIKEQAIKEGMKTLRDSAIENLLAGKTTVDEVLSVTAAG